MITGASMQTRTIKFRWYFRLETKCHNVFLSLGFKLVELGNPVASANFPFVSPFISVVAPQYFILLSITVLLAPFNGKHSCYLSPFWDVSMYYVCICGSCTVLYSTLHTATSQNGCCCYWLKQFSAVDA